MPSKKLRSRQAKASKDNASAPAPAPEQAPTLAQMDRAKSRALQRRASRSGGFIQGIPSSQGQHIPSHARAELRSELGPAAAAHKAATKGSTPNAAPAPAPASTTVQPWAATVDGPGLGALSLSTVPDVGLCQDDETLDIVNTPLIDLLCGKYKNITSLFMGLMMERKMKFMVQKTLCERDYFENPAIQLSLPCDFSPPVMLGVWAICSVGYLEAMLLAVQRTLHYNKHVNTLDDDSLEDAFCRCWSDGHQVNVHVITKFNGKRFQFRAIESGPDKSFSLYLMD